MNSVPQLDICAEIASLIQPISQSDYHSLELDLLKYGCKEPLLIWNNTIIDGHKRYKLCQTHHIAFSTEEIQLGSLLEAISYICSIQVKRNNLAIEWRKYLIGKWTEAERELGFQEAHTEHISGHPMTVAAAAHNRIAHIAAALHLSNGTLLKYREYAEAIDRIANNSMYLREQLLAGKLKLSHKNTLFLSFRTAEDIRQLEACTKERKISHMLYSDIVHELSWSHFEMQLSHKYTHKKERPPQPTAEIKKMPKYDPDASIASLALTIPSWCNTIERTIKATHFDKTSSYARQQLQTQLVVLKSNTDTLLNTLKEISYV